MINKDKYLLKMENELKDHKDLKDIMTFHLNIKLPNKIHKFNKTQRQL